MLLPFSFPATVASGTPYNSLPINVNGQFRGVVGFLSDQAVTLTVKRYADAAGLIPVNSSAITQVFAANVPNSVGWNDGLPCGSIVITVTNSSGQVANLSSGVVNLAP